MELQLAAVLGSLALGGAVLVLFFGKWWQPLADTDRRVKELADAVEALLRQRAEVLGHDTSPASDPVRAWLRRVQEAQDELASIKERPSRGWPSSSSRRCARSGSRARRSSRPRWPRRSHRSRCFATRRSCGTSPRRWGP